MAQIDDVQYSKDNSELISYIFYSDSKLRNKKAYPYPQEYVIEFTEPFRNVVSFKVLDVSLPRTMYNIDLHNNSISFSINNNPFKTVFLDDKDYDIDELIQELTAILNDDIVENGRTLNISISCRGLSIPAENKNLLSFQCQYPFVFDMKNSTVSEPIGFDLWSEENSDRYSKIYTHQDQTHEQLFGSVQQDNVDLTQFEGPTGISRSRIVGLDSWLGQKFTSSLFQALKSVKIRVARIGDTTGLSSQLDVEIWTHDSINNKPDSVVVTQAVFPTTFNGGEFEIPFDAATFGQNVSFQTGEVFWLVIKGYNNQVYPGDDITPIINPNTGTEGYYALYFGAVELLAGANEADFTNTFSQYDGTNWNFIVDDDNVEPFNLFQLNVVIETSIQQHTLIGPGLIQLTGERYVVLRCPEIEEHMYRSLSFGKFSPGIGLFKLGVMGFSDIRYDFGSVATRYFHPIGKLNKLTFRFERQDGSPYDFKGVNNTMIISIEYQQPKQIYKLTKSILNPQYEPNFMLYKQKIDEREASDDENDEEFPFQLANQIKNEQLQQYQQLYQQYKKNPNIKFDQRRIQN